MNFSGKRTGFRQNSEKPKIRHRRGNFDMSKETLRYKTGKGSFICYSSLFDCQKIVNTIKRDDEVAMAYILVTNNDQVYQMYSEGNDRLLKKIDYLPEKDLLAVLIHVRDLIHQGHELLTHPLTGSIKPYETPFKSICINADKGPVDFSSVTIIEGAIATAEKFLKDKRPIDYPESILEDFRLIDLSLINSGVESIREFG